MYLIKILKLGYVRHISRESEDCWEKKLLELIPMWSKRMVGRPRTQWVRKLFRQWEQFERGMQSKGIDGETRIGLC